MFTGLFKNLNVFFIFSFVAFEVQFKFVPTFLNSSKSKEYASDIISHYLMFSHESGCN